MDERWAGAASVVVAVAAGAFVYLTVSDAALATAAGIAWGVATGLRVRTLGRDESIDGADWWTATIVGISLLVAVLGLSSLPLSGDLKLALGLAILGVGAAAASVGAARERALAGGR